MSKFKVGDRVVVKDYDNWTGVKGVVLETVLGRTKFKPDEGSTYVRGGAVIPSYIATDAGWWRDETFELIEPGELTELRQFKADAIVKYPDLGLTAEEAAMLAIYKEVYGIDEVVYKISIEQRAVGQLMTKAIQWGREHAN